jgi:hypothetical protein
MPLIDPEEVERAFMDCLFREGEDTTVHVRADGITQDVGFHPSRLESHRAQVEAWLQALPENFTSPAAGGWSFLQACNDRNGEQWTGLHLRMEQLFQLGVGLGAVKLLTPRKMWPMLSGGMPYYQVLEPDA